MYKSPISFSFIRERVHGAHCPRKTQECACGDHDFRRTNQRLVSHCDRRRLNVGRSAGARHAMREGGKAAMFSPFVAAVLPVLERTSGPILSHLRSMVRRLESNGAPKFLIVAHENNQCNSPRGSSQPFPIVTPGAQISVFHSLPSAL